MLEYARWKYVVALLVMLLSALYALPNLYPQDPSVQITANRGYKVDAKLQQQVAATLAKAGVKPKAVELDEKQGELLVRLGGVEAQTRASDVLNEAIGEHFVGVEVADNVRLRVQKGAIANVLPKGTLKSA